MLVVEKGKHVKLGDISKMALEKKNHLCAQFKWS